MSRCLSKSGYNHLSKTQLLLNKLHVSNKSPCYCVLYGVKLQKEIATIT
jgi:hypothetical protein